MDTDIKIYPKIESLYKHYKGGLYKVLTLSKHTETNETLVIINLFILVVFMQDL